MKYCKNNQLYWTEETCLEAAKKCKTIKEFSITYPSAYIKSIKNGWRIEYTWLKRAIKLDVISKTYLIYVYEDTENKICYIGLTNNLIKRKSSHKKTRYYKNKKGEKYHYRDSVNKYFFEKNMIIPEPLILENNLNALEAQTQEKYWCDYYTTNGWKLLNKAKTGKNSSSIGGCEKKWTYENLKNEASKYKTKEEFKKNKNSAYKVARELKLLNEFFPPYFPLIENEIWKDIPNYEKLYQISNFKRIKHLKDENHTCERLLSIFKKNNNDCVSLYKNNKAKILQLNKIYNMVFYEL